MLFYHVSLREARKIKEILQDFMMALGTLINNEKSNILFFNTTRSIQYFLAHMLGFGIGTLRMKYLGVPLAYNYLNTSYWQDLLVKIQSKHGGWAFCALNVVGRTVLLKVVL